MKKLILSLLVIGLLAPGCTPSDTAQPAVEATPTAAGDEITEMDFESGEVDRPATETEEPQAEASPDTP